MFALYRANAVRKRRLRTGVALLAMPELINDRRIHERRVVVIPVGRSPPLTHPAGGGPMKTDLRVTFPRPCERNAYRARYVRHTHLINGRDAEVEVHRQEKVQN